jgi:hypothetical protein
MAKLSKKISDVQNFGDPNAFGDKVQNSGE